MMRLHRFLLACALVLLCARTTNAAERMKVGFMLDFVTGVTIPIADADYKNFADASFKLGLRMGAVLHITDRFGIAPEAEFDFIPLEPDKSDFPSSSGTLNVSTAIYRERGLFGARFILNFGIGSVYARTMIGVDHIGGTTSAAIGGFGGSTDFSSTGFTLEPGAGVQFNVVRHLVVGFTTGFPIAFHDFGNGNNDRHFTAVDVDFLGVVGVRL
ncbi:MAG TPA: outer membrane beta-barrel protein [Polyangia bacterium]|jgi:opacity protein-like surface antigen